MTFEKIRELIVDQLGIDEDMVEMDTNLMKDLEGDSLDMVEIILGIEEDFQVWKFRMRKQRNLRPYVTWWNTWMTTKNDPTGMRSVCCEIEFRKEGWLKYEK